KTSCDAYSIVGQAGRYRFTTAPGDFNAAAADCASDGGHLAKIEDTVEDAFIDTAFIAAALAPGSYVWIRLPDPTTTETDVWYDGTALGDYNGFPMGHIPHDMDGTHNCVDKKGDGDRTWAIYLCSTVEQGLCECD